MCENAALIHRLRPVVIYINVKTEEYEKNSIAPPRGKYLEQGKSLHSKLPMRY